MTTQFKGTLHIIPRIRLLDPDFTNRTVSMKRNRPKEQTLSKVSFLKQVGKFPKIKYLALVLTKFLTLMVLDSKKRMQTSSQEVNDLILLLVDQIMMVGPSTSRSRDKPSTTWKDLLLKLQPVTSLSTHTKRNSLVLLSTTRQEASRRQQVISRLPSSAYRWKAQWTWIKFVGTLNELFKCKKQVKLNDQTSTCSSEPRISNSRQSILGKAPSKIKHSKAKRWRLMKWWKSSHPSNFRT